MPIRNVSPSNSSSVSSAASQDVEAGRTQDPQNRPGGAGGGIPRISNTISTQPPNTLRSIMNFITRASAPIMAQIPGSHNQAQNRQILADLTAGKPTPFSAALSSGIHLAKDDLQGLPGFPSDIGSMVKNSVSALQMNPPNTLYKPETLQQGIRSQLKIEAVKASVVEEVKIKLGQAGAPNDEGSIATLLTSSGTKYIDMKLIGIAGKDELPGLRANLVKSMVQEGISQKNYTEAKKEALVKGEQMLKDVGLNEGNTQKEMKNLKMGIDGAALQLEEQLTEKNGGTMPAIAKHQYEKVFSQQVDALGVRVGIY